MKSSHKIWWFPCSHLLKSHVFLWAWSMGVGHISSTFWRNNSMEQGCQCLNTAMLTATVYKCIQFKQFRISPSKEWDGQRLGCEHGQLIPQIRHFEAWRRAIIALQCQIISGNFGDNFTKVRKGWLINSVQVFNNWWMSGSSVATWMHFLLGKLYQVINILTKLK